LEALLNDKEAVAHSQKFAAHLYGSTAERKIKFAESNAGLLAMALMYAAKYYGVDSHPMSGVDFDGVKKELGLSENKTVVMLIALGYFDDTKTLYPRIKRKEYADIVKEI
jgi:putative NAD(P)H nitroreductase